MAIQVISGSYLEKRFTFGANGTPSDPDTVTITVESPSGDVSQYVYGTAPQWTRISEGVYKFRVQFTETGTYEYTTKGEWDDPAGAIQSQGKIHVVAPYAST